MKTQSVKKNIFFWRKNVVLSLFFVFSFFFFPVSIAHAACDPSVSGFIKNTLTGDCGARASWVDGMFSLAGSAADSMFKPIALALISLEAVLVNVAAIIFALTLDPNFFLAIMNDPVVYDIWKIVRDTLNMLFILVLLFSAFATIYQVDKYRYNKILLDVIIMALLVNFSWPIARTIIDFFNSMMYFFVQSMFGTSGQKAANDILSVMNLKAMFLPNGDASDWIHIFIAIFVMGIFAYTLLRLALFMLIRLLALPVLVMVSPVGFAGMATPLTQKHAKKWWDALFQYASYGPLVIFQVLAALKLLQHLQ